MKMSFDVLFSYFPRATVYRYEHLCRKAGSMDQAWRAPDKLVLSWVGDVAWVREFLNWRRHIDSPGLIDELNRYSIRAIDRHDPEYPQLLLEIHDPPICLFVRGFIPATTHSLSIVGSRRASSYGRQALRSLVSPILSSEMTIISGLARGIDRAAHELALEYAAPTIAVVGSGLAPHVLSPDAYSLIDRIIMSGGAIISEYPPTFQATPYSFPKRNRIIAGFSPTTMVVEATKKSGALITASVARDENREVVTIPHPITSRTGEGCHSLLQDGAMLVSTPEQLQAYFGVEYS